MKAKSNIRPTNSYDILKIIAIISMFLDHIGLFLFPECDYLRILGRLAFPMFIFLIGYSGKFSNFGITIACIIIKILLHGLLYGIDNLGYHVIFENIFWSIFIIKLSMLFIHKYLINSNFSFIVSVIFVILTPYTDNLFGYGTIGISFAIYGYLKAQNLGNDLTFMGVFLQIFYFMYSISIIINPYHSCILMITCILLAIILQNFTCKRALKNHKYINFISRNSAYIYMIHFEILYYINS